MPNSDAWPQNLPTVSTAATSAHGTSSRPGSMRDSNSSCSPNRRQTTNPRNTEPNSRTRPTSIRLRSANSHAPGDLWDCEALSAKIGCQGGVLHYKRLCENSPLISAHSNTFTVNLTPDQRGNGMASTLEGKSGETPLPPWPIPIAPSKLLKHFVLLPSKRGRHEYDFSRFSRLEWSSRHHGPRGPSDHGQSE